MINVNVAYSVDQYSPSFNLFGSPTNPVVPGNVYTFRCAAATLHLGFRKPFSPWCAA
jgi:hypothetical protein